MATSQIVPINGAALQGPARLEFTAEQRQMIRATFCGGEHPASDAEFAVLMEIARARGLNPLLRQIHFVSRWDSQRKAFAWATQISIDGLRAVAERTGLYDGQDEPEFESKEGKPLVCRVRIYKKSVGRPFVGVARWEEYAQHKKDGGLTSFWASKPYLMLAKCAEALALRKAFPEDTSGLYVPEEQPEEEEAPRPAPQRTRTEAVKRALSDGSERRTARLLALSVDFKQLGVDPKAWVREHTKIEKPSKDWSDAELGLVEAAWVEYKLQAEAEIEQAMIEGGGGGELP